MSFDKNTLPDNLKGNDLDFLGFAHELRDCIDDCFDRRLCDLYSLLNIKNGDITPFQTTRLNAILDQCANNLTALAIELAAQNKPTLPRCPEYDAILTVLHKMYDDFDTDDNEKAEKFFNEDFTIGFGDTKVEIMNGATQYEVVEACLLRLLEETAESYGNSFDYSDTYIKLVDGHAKFIAATEEG